MKNIVLFHPFVPSEAIDHVSDVLKTRWIGQGPKVDEFEVSFKEKFATKAKCIAVGSGTDALHLSYILAGLKPGDHWCLCAPRWLEAYADGMAPLINLKATEESTLKIIDLEILMQFAYRESK